MASGHSTALADNVRAELARRRMRQAELAESLGVTPQAVSLKLAGRRPFTDREIAAVARLFDMPIGDLFAEPVGARSAGIAS